MKTICVASIFCVILLSTVNCVSGRSSNSTENVRTKQKERRSIAKNNDDGYVVEGMTQVQHDQPSFMRPSYNQMQRESSMLEKIEQRKRVLGAPSPNVQFTKEIVIKQGRLKGLIRTMHPQTGLKSVRQYLGIPYAAAPIGNGRFMPPGKLFISINSVQFLLLFLVFPIH